MDWLLNTYKLIKGESPYYLMTFALICLFIIFMPAILSSSILETIPDIVSFREKYFAWICILCVFLLVFGLGGFFKKSVEYFKKRKGVLALKKEKQNLLNKLETLYRENKLKFKTREECVEWGNKVAPILRFNPIYYNEFMANFNIIPLRLTEHTLGPAVETMKSQVKMAIEELRNDLDINN